MYSRSEPRADRPYEDEDIRAASGTRPAADPLAELVRIIGRDDPYFARPDALQPEPELRGTYAEDARPAHHDDIGDDRYPDPVRDDRWDEAGHRPDDYPPEPVSATYGHSPYRHDDLDSRLEAALARDLAAFPADLGNGRAPSLAPVADSTLAYAASRDGRSAYETPQVADPRMASRESEDAELAPRRAKAGAVMVFAVLGLAAVGAAGAFAYRAMTGGAVQGNPPMIMADQGPAKVAATPQAPAAGQQQRLVYDRAGEGPATGARVVPREEQPVDPERATQPRVVLPSSIPVQQPARPPGSAPMLPGTSASADPDQPRAVRTVTIRQDPAASGVAPSGAPTVAGASTLPTPGMPAPQAAPISASAPARTVSAMPMVPAAAPPAAPAPVAGVRDTAALAPVRDPMVRQVAPPPMAVNEPEPPRGPAPAPAQQRLASVPPAPAVPAAAAAPPAAGAGAPGTFLVQIHSNRSEADARTAFRQMQQRYPALASYQPVIRRADLGDRGVFFRVNVGPFDNRDDANQFCIRLRGQGGECVVQRN